MKKKDVKRLQKETEKQTYKPIFVSQKKANLLFGSMLGLFVVGGLTVSFLSVKNIAKVNKLIEQPTQVQENKNVDKRLEQFLDSYVSTYFTFDPKSDKVEEDIKKLNAFYDVVPQQKNQGHTKNKMALVSARFLYGIEGVALYRVVYDTQVGDKTNRVAIEFFIPYGEKDNKYYISGLPWFAPISDLKASGLSVENTLTLNASDGLNENEKKDVVDFLNVFFKNYTTNQANLDLISKDIKAIGGSNFKSLDYTYVIKDGDNVTVYAQATLELAGTSHSENYTFHLRKNKESYFVEKMEHTIPVDYAKKDENKGE